MQAMAAQTGIPCKLSMSTGQQVQAMSRLLHTRADHTIYVSHVDHKLGAFQGSGTQAVY
jgi:hypothetical protein